MTSTPPPNKRLAVHPVLVAAAAAVAACCLVLPAASCPGGVPLTKALVETGQPERWADATCVPDEEFMFYTGDITLVSLAHLLDIGEHAFNGVEGTLTMAGSFPKLRNIQSYAFIEAGNAQSNVTFHAGLPLLEDIGMSAFSRFKGTLTLTGAFPKLRNIQSYAFTDAGWGVKVTFDAGLPLLEDVGKGAFNGFRGTVTFGGEYYPLLTKCYEERNPAVKVCPTSPTCTAGRQFLKGVSRNNSGTCTDLATCAANATYIATAATATRNRVCTKCSNATCPAGTQRMGTCSGTTDGFRCIATTTTTTTATTTTTTATTTTTTATTTTTGTTTTMTTATTTTTTTTTTVTTIPAATPATAAKTAESAQPRGVSGGQVIARKEVTKVKPTLKMSTPMPKGTCEAQTDDDKTTNLKSIAAASGKSALVDLSNSGAACEADNGSRRRAAATKDNFAVTFAFVDTVTAADVKAAIADVNVKIQAGNFKVSLAVDGTSVPITVTEVATQGEKTVTVWVVTYAPNNSTNVTLVTPKNGAALAGSSALAMLSLAAALFA